MNEIFVDIVGYEGYYQVSNLGRVKRLIGQYCTKERILKPTLTKDGYLRISLCNRNNNKRVYIHQIVAQAFLPNPNNHPCINHKDENKQNNFVWVNDDGSVDESKSNLEYCTVNYNNNYGSRNKRIGETCKKIGLYEKVAQSNKENGVYKKLAEIHKKNCSKPILQYSLDGELITEYESLMEVERNGFCRQNVTACCQGKYRYAHDYIWRYKKNDEQN